MVEAIRSSLRDSKATRWTALVLVALSMLAGYYVVDMIAPLQKLLQSSLKWTPGHYGFFSGSEYWLNMLGFLLISGIILDKLGIRFTGLAAAAVMVLGASIKLYGLSDTFNQGGLGYSFLGSFWNTMPPSVKMASFGYAIFGVGVEMLGITVSRAIVKWFKGKEMALAMGMEMATARMGASIAFFFSVPMAGVKNVDGIVQGNRMAPIYFGIALLIIGFLTFLAYTFMDKKLDEQEGTQASSESEEAFHFSDLGKILSNKGFWLISLLCVLFYSGVFPFLKYAVNMMQSKLGISEQAGGYITGLLPVGTIILTPIVGHYLDTKGKGATMMIYGAILMIAAHLTFALAPLNIALAILAIVVLGVAFSLVPASMWPSVPKIVEERYLGSAFGLVFLIQNWGLGLFPWLIGQIIEKVNPGVTDTLSNAQMIVDAAKTPAAFELARKAFETANDTAALEVARKAMESAQNPALVEAAQNTLKTTVYNYTTPMLVFAGLGVCAVVLGWLLLKEDKAKGYGLEKPNKQPQEHPAPMVSE